MFDDAVIVQSAMSAFNNAALAAPAFLWWAILATPLFVMVYWCGNSFREKIGWARDVLLKTVSVWTVFLTLAWIVLFGGNYGVLRDTASTLPFMVAAIVFVAVLFLSSNTRDVRLPSWRGGSARGRIKIAAAVLLGVAALGLSDMHAWWGPLLQIGAAAAGAVLGRIGRGEMRLVPGGVLVMLAATTAILMQPEFFRFGQLGTLTLAHLVGLMSVGVAAAAAIALRNVRPCGRIHRSAYIKLKWMMRFVALLGLALFGLTESVPVFLGTTVVFFVMFAMSVWHAKIIPAALGDKMFAAMMCAFGVITTMPAITALGILYWMSVPAGNTWRDAKFLL